MQPRAQQLPVRTQVVSRTMPRKGSANYLGSNRILMGSNGRMILPPSFKRLYEVNPLFLSELLHPKHSNHFICICLGMIAPIQLRKL